MPVTLLQLKTSLGILLNDPDEDVYTPDQKTQAINFSISYVQDWFDTWQQKPLVASFPIATVAGQELYALPEDFRHMEKVQTVDNAGNFIKVDPILFSRAEEFQRDIGEGEAFPAFYYIVGKEIGLIPNKALQTPITVFHTPAEIALTDDADEVEMPRWVGNMISFKAASYAASMNGDLRQKGAFEQDYKQIERAKELTIAQYQKQEGQLVIPTDGLWETHLIWT